MCPSHGKVQGHLNPWTVLQGLENIYPALAQLQPAATFQPAVHAVLQRMDMALDFLATASGNESTAPQVLH